ncbi:MAG: glycosyltransferase family 4 protein [Patescibacteria group bacterium]|nr:glycosyltransferase family 4 protein [Patescibacteria group bacterium]
MKITLITPIFPPVIGGPASYTWEVSHRLNKEHEVTVLAFGDGGRHSDEVPVELVRVYDGFFRELPFIGSIVRQANMAAKVFYYGFISDFLYIQGPLVVGYTASLVGRLLRKPMLMKYVGDIAWETAHRKKKTLKNLDEFLADGDGGILRRLQRKAFRRAHNLIVPSQYLRDVLVTYYKMPSDKVHVVYNAVEVPDLEKKVDENVFVTVGRLVPHKNIAGIIEAMALLPKKYELRVVGSGPEHNDLRELADKLDVKVNFLGPQPRDKTLQEVANGRLFILNSNYEGLPHAVVEAMLLKTPVIATDILGTTEVATDETAVLSEPNNPEDLAAKIEEALKTDKTQVAYDFVSKRFNWDQHLEGLNQLFSKTKK